MCCKIIFTYTFAVTKVACPVDDNLGRYSCWNPVCLRVAPTKGDIKHYPMCLAKTNTCITQCVTCVTTFEKTKQDSYKW